MTALEVVTGEWANHAACAGMDPDLFFPHRGDMTAIRVAKTICHPCPVRHDCLQHALDHNEPGIWGGTTGRERNRIRRPPQPPGGQLAQDILTHLREHGPIEDPNGHATALLRHAIGHTGSANWVSASLARLETAGLIERTAHTPNRCHRIEAL